MSYSKKKNSTQMELDENIPKNNQSMTNFDTFDKYFRHNNNCNYEIMSNNEASEETKGMPEEFLKENMDDKIIYDDADEDLAIARTASEKRDSVISDFEEADCGEPLISQHLSIDFTPIAGVDDNEHVQKKCLDFWEFLHKQPQIHKFKVYPVSDATLTPDSEVNCADTKDLGKDLKKNVSTPALDLITNKSIMKNVFSTKVSGKYCEDGLEDYTCGSNVQRHRGRRRRSNLSKVTSGVTTDRGYDMIPSAERVSSPNELKRLCEEMEEWDGRYPKSMDPPAHAPTFIHANLQGVRPSISK